MVDFNLNGKKIWIAGHTGLVGRALYRALSCHDCEVLSVAHTTLDLTQQSDTYDWIRDHKPDAIIMAAGRVGGIGANAAQPADFLFENLAMAQNVIHGAYQNDVSKLLYLGSSCVYPRDCPQPIREESLLSAPLEVTNEGYAIAKIAGLKLCEKYREQYGCNFISAMPTNLYGPYDNFNRESAHVIPALIDKMHMAKMSGTESVDIWGSGNPLREYLYADDLADALAFLLQNYRDEKPINIGSGDEYTIAQTAAIICDVVGYDGSLIFNPEKPDGTPRKALDCSRLSALGWAAKMPFIDGLKRTYAWYTQNYTSKTKGTAVL